MVHFSRRRALSAAISLTTTLALAGVGVVSGAAAAPSRAAAARVAPMAKLDPGLRRLARHPHGQVHVIVTGGRAHEAQVARLGGRVTRDLSLIHGFAATVPAKALLRLAAMSGVRSVTADRRTGVAAAITPASTSGTNEPSVYRKVVGGDALAAQGYAGQNVTVALIDTGVTSMPDIANALVPVTTNPLTGATASCMNFSGDATCNDEYGHGTFLAGLIAGNGASSGGKYVGVAPRAKILSVKIAGANGSADVSTIIAALEWVVQTRSTYNTQVVNLSLGTNSTQSYTLDPLDYAVEQAWKAGLVVDVAASNLGPAPETIDDPADDPFVITVGAINDMGTVTTNDDTVPDFSSRGPTAADGLAKPDVVAPGAHLVSLAAPGAAITQQFPPNMPAPYRRGSGTSMSTAVVSGLVADMLSAEPGTSPDRVKYQLMAGAKPDASPDPMTVGAGLVYGPGALAAGPGLANQGVQPGLGTGSLQAARGTVTVQANDLLNTVISGNLTQQLLTWDPLTDLLDPADWTSGGFTGGNWYGGNWYGGNWYGGNWYGGNWYGGNWYGGNWYAGAWYGGNWYGCWDY